jgi:aminomethyltransferase
MPLHYRAGALAEHRYTRLSAGLFDLSHFPQVLIDGEDAPALLEDLTPGAIRSLPAGKMRYTVLATASGGIIDDLTLSREAEGLFLILNVQMAEVVLPLLKARFGRAMRVLEGHALLALQGPDAATILCDLLPGIDRMAPLDVRFFAFGGVPLRVSRSGYTGEDGFELSLPGRHAPSLFALLARDPAVMPAGLAARESLRIEAGYARSGEDFDESTTLLEAGFDRLVSASRGPADFPGASMLREREKADAWRRVPLKVLPIRPVGRGTPLLDPSTGEVIGVVTSGNIGLGDIGPAIMGYVEKAYAREGTTIAVETAAGIGEALVAPGRSGRHARSSPTSRPADPA